jgi:hypothetical protein
VEGERVGEEREGAERVGKEIGRGGRKARGGEKKRTQWREVEEMRREESMGEQMGRRRGEEGGQREGLLSSLKGGGRCFFRFWGSLGPVR